MGFFARAANLVKGIVSVQGRSPDRHAEAALDAELRAANALPRVTRAPVVPPVTGGPTVAAPSAPTAPTAPTAPERDEFGEIKRTL